MNYIKDVESNSVSLRLRKSVTTAEIDSHSILTDDVFSYVDFWFKTHKKIMRDQNGKRPEQDCSFYWTQAKNFYVAAKSLPIESSPLPMYYCMLNAMKAYVFYNAESFDKIKNAFNGHGLHEGAHECDERASLDKIFIRRDGWGVFVEFAHLLEPDFNTKWKSKDEGAVSVKDLMRQLPFIHSAYISTYSLPRKQEGFIPLRAGSAPTFGYFKGKKIRLFVDIDRRYFKQDATALPEEIKQTIPSCFTVDPDDGFRLISEETFKKSDILKRYRDYREHFSYISANQRLWYLKRENSDSVGLSKLNSMVASVAIVHRFSEIVRYKPEQMYRLLQGKENWLIHEFLSIVLDQFMDEIACEITKKEIMATRTK